MTDRELLELAAKAAGMRGFYRDGPAPGIVADGSLEAAWRPWNPLLSDADALRLAVKSDIGFCQGTNCDRAAAISEYADGGRLRYCIEYHDEHPDKRAATRRAIVRSAAEMGKREKGK